MSPRIDDVKVALVMGLVSAMMWVIALRLWGVEPLWGAASLLALLFGWALLDGRFGSTPNVPLWLGAIIGLWLGANAPLEWFHR
jgi:hypothetical protein